MDLLNKTVGFATFEMRLETRIMAMELKTSALLQVAVFRLCKIISSLRDMIDIYIS